MRFEEEIREYKQKIDILLREYLEAEKRKSKSVSPANEKVMEFVLDFCGRSGKRIRPILMIKGYEAVGGRDLDEIMRASISIELLEGYLLIHDDIIDEDEMRRGGPAFHKMAVRGAFGSPKTTKSRLPRDKHFGISAGIIAGDMLGGLAVRVIMESGFREDFKLRAIQEFINAELNCFHGELYDVILEKEEAEEEDFFRMVDLKTGSYTTILPLVMGAILGQGREPQIGALREYGRLLGRAFQIRDDILGTFGDEKRIGKPVVSDIRQGKKTLLLIYALQNANKETLKFLHHTIGNKDLQGAELHRVRQIFKHTGALSYSKNKAIEYANMAKAILKLAYFELESKEFLSQLADFMVEREY